MSDKNSSTVDAYSGLSDEFYDSLGPEGGFERRALLNPAIFRLLGDVSGQRVMDAGCGHGYLSRLLADKGASVVGVEPARGPFSYAARAEEEKPQGIEYLQRDLSRLGDVGVQFDAVVANMVLLDIPDWRPAMANCVGALRRGGVFVYSLHHPIWVPGRFDTWARKGHVEVSEYLNEYEQVGEVSSTFHRPLSVYINETIRLACDITEIAEPQLRAEGMESDDQEILTRIPNFIVISARKR